MASVTVSPDGSLCASGGKDGVARLWDLAEGKRLYSLDAADPIHALAFSPNRYWLVAATQTCVKIWDLESKSTVVELRPEFPPVSKKAQTPHCVSLAWSDVSNARGAQNGTCVYVPGCGDSRSLTPCGLEVHDNNIHTITDVNDYNINNYNCGAAHHIVAFSS